MKRLALLLTLAFAVGLLFTTGCVQNPGIPGMGPTASPTGGTPGTLTTGPTQEFPADYAMEFQVQSNGNTVNPMIEVYLRGGNGFNLDTRIDISMTEPDGTVQTATMLPPFSMGQTVSFPAAPTRTGSRSGLPHPPGNTRCTAR